MFGQIKVWRPHLALVLPLTIPVSAVHIYHPQTKFAKVMLIHVSVYPRGGGRGGVPRQVHPGASTPPGAGTPPWAGTRPPGQVPHPGSSACWEIWTTNGRYVSYWNAFLFLIKLERRSEWKYALQDPDTKITLSIPKLLRMNISRQFHSINCLSIRAGDHIARTNSDNKNEFQQDAYCPLVDRIPWGVCPLPLQTPLPWLQTLPTPANEDPPGHVTCDACWVANPHPPVNRITDGCKNITLPQTSFAGSKNVDTVLKNDYKHFRNKMSAPRDDCIHRDIPIQTYPPPGHTHLCPQKGTWTRHTPHCEHTHPWKHYLPTTSLSGGNDVRILQRA